MPEECSTTPGFKGVFAFWAPQFQTLARDGSALGQGDTAPRQNSSGIWDRLSWSSCSQVICSDLISYTALSLLRSFGPISVISEMNSRNNLDIFVQTQQH